MSTYTIHIEVTVLDEELIDDEAVLEIYVENKIAEDGIVSVELITAQEG